MQIDSIITDPVWQGFQLYGEPGHVVSLVGGGGKTTLMYHMASLSAGEGKKVLVTTTTHIRKPTDGTYAGTVSEAERLWKKGKYAVIGTQEEKNGKLSMPDAALLAELRKKADLVIVEADGAKMFPCKVPREKEPVFLPECDIVTAVMGLTAIGKPLSEVCFGIEEAKKNLGKTENAVLTEADAVKILSSLWGSRKNVGERIYYVVLNQCDDARRKAMGRRIAQRLFELGIYNVVFTAFDPKERY